MRASYGVVWREDEHPLARGKLELLSRCLRLDGLTASTHVTREIAYDELVAVRVGRSSGERLNGQPSLVLESRSGASLVLATVGQAGAVAELAERLAALT